MEIELIPHPGAGSPVSLAAVSAIVREGLVPEQTPAGAAGTGVGSGEPCGSWSAARTGDRSPPGGAAAARVGIAVRREPRVAGVVPRRPARPADDASSRNVLYVPLVRSTRGAMRA